MTRQRHTARTPSSRSRVPTCNRRAWLKSPPAPRADACCARHARCVSRPVRHAARQERHAAAHGRRGLPRHLRRHRRAARLARLTPESADRYRRAAAEASSRARPDIVDRNGEILADRRQDRSRSSPSRAASSTRTRRSSCSPPCCPISTPANCARSSARKRGFVWVKRESHAAGSGHEVFRLGLPGVGFLPENKRVYPNGPVARARARLHQHRQQGIAGIEKYIDGQGLADLSSAGFKVASPGH